MLKSEAETSGEVVLGGVELARSEGDTSLKADDSVGLQPSPRTGLIEDENQTPPTRRGPPSRPPRADGVATLSFLSALT